jgi:hypothetical protein
LDDLSIPSILLTVKGLCRRLNESAELDSGVRESDEDPSEGVVDCSFYFLFFSLFFSLFPPVRGEGKYAVTEQTIAGEGGWEGRHHVGRRGGQDRIKPSKYVIIKNPTRSSHGRQIAKMPQLP